MSKYIKMFFNLQNKAKQLKGDVTTHNKRVRNLIQNYRMLHISSNTKIPKGKIFNFPNNIGL